MDAMDTVDAMVTIDIVDNVVAIVTVEVLVHFHAKSLSRKGFC